MQIAPLDIVCNPSQRPHREQQAAPLTAQLIGTHRCEVLRHVATAYAPALALCRHLLAAGLDPNRALHAYHNGIVSLRIRSIREGAYFDPAEGGRR
jgi:hypothetical protein